MITTWTQPTWGMSGPEFLWLYGALCVAATIWVVVWRRAAGGPVPPGADPDLGIHELAMLGGGPQLAITSAATQLMRDGALRRGPSDGLLEAAGELPEDADPLERAVFETVARRPGMSVDAMRAEVVKSDVLLTMKAELVAAGLLLSDGAARLLRWRWLIGAALAALGAARLWAGVDGDDPVGFLLVMVMIVCYSTQDVFRNRPVATRHGDAIVDRWRAECGDPKTQAVAGDRALTAALFGGAALWFAEPDIASALGLPIEQQGSGRGGGGSGGCGSCGGGCGGCGGCGG
jgi:uncharacterized protein (TIGR04222 family)